MGKKLADLWGTDIHECVQPETLCSFSVPRIRSLQLLQYSTGTGSEPRFRLIRKVQVSVLVSGWDDWYQNICSLKVRRRRISQMKVGYNLM